MLALIDGDIVAYRCAASTFLQEDGTKVPAPWGIIKSRCNEMLTTIFAAVGADKHKIWISGVGNFRYDLYPQYKANRTAPRPPHLEDLKEFLVVEWGARVADGIEADDALAMDQGKDTIICSIDKDMRQVPGWHHNFVKGVTDFVTEEQGLQHFYRSMLIGDSSDNVRGVTGIGPVKASRHLPEGLSERQMFDIVRNLFGDDQAFSLAGELLWIRRTEGDSWALRTASWMDAKSGQEQAVKLAISGRGSMDESSDSTSLSLTTEGTSGSPSSGTETEPSSVLITPVQQI